MSDGERAGIIIAAIVVLVVMIIAASLCQARRQRQRDVEARRICRAQVYPHRRPPVVPVLAWVPAYGPPPGVAPLGVAGPAAVPMPMLTAGPQASQIFYYPTGGYRLAVAPPQPTYPPPPPPLQSPSSESIST